MVLEPEKDPFGAAALAYLKGEESATVEVYPDIGEPDVIPAAYLMREPDKWPELERIAISACRGKVLDIGAGGGSHALVLQQKGQTVHAIDISPGLVQAMQERGVKQASLCDIWAFSGKGYDTILMMMNGIGIVGNLAGLRSLLMHVKDMLVPGGQILLDSSDIAFVYQVQDVPVPYWEGEDEYYGAVSFYMRYGKVIGDTFPWLYIDFDLLEQIAGETGYATEHVYEDNHYHYLARLTRKENG